MIVVDVNTIAYLWIPGEFTEYAEKALLKDENWVAPFLWRSEFRNILAGYLRRGDLSALQVDICIQNAEKQMSSREFMVPSPLVMSLVGKTKCSAYDCEYMALADDLNVKLVTSDKLILREFPGTAVELKAFCLC